MLRKTVCGAIERRITRQGNVCLAARSPGVFSLYAALPFAEKLPRMSVKNFRMGKKCGKIDGKA